MFKRFETLILSMFALAVCGLAAPAWADDDPGQPLRLIGETPTIGEAGPTRFVIDARVKRGFDRDEVDVDGWFASAVRPAPDAPDATLSGELNGKCLDGHCLLTADLDDHKIVLHGDLLAPSGPIEGRFEVTGDLAADKLTKGAASFSPLTGEVPGMGALATPDAADSLVLDDLLLWAGTNPAFGDSTAHPLEGFQHEHLANWQHDNQRMANGLLFAADLDLLKAQRDKAMKAAGWTPLSGEGWSAGYPASLLPMATRSGPEQRFASHDGKALLVIAIEAPITDEAFDALVEKLTSGDEPERTGYTRTGGDMEISYRKAGQARSEMYYLRSGGLARLTYTYPDGDNPYADMDSIISRSLRVTDALKPAP